MKAIRPNLDCCSDLRPISVIWRLVWEGSLEPAGEFPESVFGDCHSTFIACPVSGVVRKIKESLTFTTLLCINWKAGTGGALPPSLPPSPQLPPPLPPPRHLCLAQPGCRGAKGRSRAGPRDRSQLPREAGLPGWLTPPPSRRLSRAEGATSGAQARAAPPALPFSSRPSLRSFHAPLPISGTNRCSSAGCGSPSQDAGARRQHSRTPGLRQHLPQQDAGPVAAAPRQTREAGEEGGDALCDPGSGRVCQPRVPNADLSSSFLCPASSFLRGSPSRDAVAIAQCRCTRIPLTQSPLHCQVSPEAPARPLNYPCRVGAAHSDLSPSPLSPGLRGPG